MTSRFDLEQKHGLIEAPKEQAGIAGDDYGRDALPPQRSYSSQLNNIPGTSNTSPYGTSNVYGTGGLPIGD